MSRRPKLLFVINDPAFFLSHRLPIARAAATEGYEVHVATPGEPEREEIIAEGFGFHPIPLERHGTRLWHEILTVIAIYRLFRSLRPDLVHLVTIKPVLYGGVAARLAGVPAMVSAISGLGHVFLSEGFRAGFLRQIAKWAYRLALSHRNRMIIFQNPDDMDLFVREKMVRSAATTIIRGSGVDLSIFQTLQEPVGIPLLLLAGRMLWEKGVGEFVEAARILRGKNIAARFILVGNVVPDSPAAVPERLLHQWQREGVIEWWGFRRDMPDTLGLSHIVCLPSYREGLPKVLVEAAAVGRPLVATDVPGCREIVRHRENGLLVPLRDPKALAAAFESLIIDQSLRLTMGAYGRRLVEEEFELGMVIEKHLQLYRKLIAENGLTCI